MMGNKGNRVQKQGRIHDYPCRGRLGRGSNELGRDSHYLGRGFNIYKILISALFYLQTAQKRKKAKCDRTDRPADRQTGLLIGRVARDKNKIKPLGDNEKYCQVKTMTLSTVRNEGQKESGLKRTMMIIPSTIRTEKQQ